MGIIGSKICGQNAELFNVKAGDTVPSARYMVKVAVGDGTLRAQHPYPEVSPPPSPGHLPLQLTPFVPSCAVHVEVIVTHTVEGPSLSLSDVH